MPGLLLGDLPNIDEGQGSQENGASSDPLDCLSHFDEVEFNKRYEAPESASIVGNGKGMKLNRRKSGKKNTGKKGRAGK